MLIAVANLRWSARCRHRGVREGACRRHGSRQSGPGTGSHPRPARSHRHDEARSTRRSATAGFLRYIVEEALAGRADRIKAYNIATAVFGRDEEFDPQSDPIVRVEAGRLRRALERYYLTAGQDDPVRISDSEGLLHTRVRRAEPLGAGSRDRRASGGGAPGTRRGGAGRARRGRCGRHLRRRAGRACRWPGLPPTGCSRHAPFAAKADAVARNGPAIFVLPFEGLDGRHRRRGRTWRAG